MGNPSVWERWETGKDDHINRIKQLSTRRCSDFKKWKWYFWSRLLLFSPHPPFLLFQVLFLFWDQISSGLSWPQSSSAAEDDLELPNSSASSSQVLGFLGTWFHAWLHCSPGCPLLFAPDWVVSLYSTHSWLNRLPCSWFGKNWWTVLPGSLLPHGLLWEKEVLWL